MVYFLRWRKKIISIEKLTHWSIIFLEKHIYPKVWSLIWIWMGAVHNKQYLHDIFLYSKPPLLKNFIIFVLLMNSLWKKPVGINWWATLMKTHFRLLVQVARSSVTVIINFTSNCYTHMRYNKCLYACAE